VTGTLKNKLTTWTPNQLFYLNIIGNLGPPEFADDLTRAITLAAGESLTYVFPSITDPDKEDKPSIVVNLGQASSFTTFNGKALQFKVASDTTLGGKSYELKITVRDNNEFKVLRTQYKIKVTIKAPIKPAAPPASTGGSPRTGSSSSSGQTPST
jgi:hypothetical protein